MRSNTMFRAAGALVLALSATAVALAGPARFHVRLVDEGGAAVHEALIVFTLADDPDQQWTIGENDAGQYADQLDLPAEQASVKISRVVAPGFMPVKVSIESRAPSGDTVQQVDEMPLAPGTPIPAIDAVAHGQIRLVLVMGNQREVMARFQQARAAARAEAERQQAEMQKAASGPYPEALRRYNAGDLEGALPYFREAAEQDPGNVELLKTWARVLYKAKKPDEFEEVAERALEKDPTSTELLMMLYSSHRERQQFQKALDDLLRVKELGARASDLLPHLDFVAKSMGREKKAIPAYEAILDLDPENVDASVALAAIYDAAGDREQSDRYLNQAVQLDPRQAPRLYSDMASRLLAGNSEDPARVDRAIALLRKAIELEPGYADAHKRLGRALWVRQDLAGAKAELERYLELSPQADDAEQIKEYLGQLSDALEQGE